MKKQLDKTIIGLFACTIIILISTCTYSLKDHIKFKDFKSEATIENDIQFTAYATQKLSEGEAVYLSDIDYIPGQSYARWDKIRYNEINDGSKITVKIENGAFSFDNGIWAHANSQVTYDISKYNYKYFTAFVGLNTTSTRGDGVRFYIYTSVDGKNWGEAKYDEVKLPGVAATQVKIELGDANYIRLVANEIKGNASDHAVYADAKLVNDISEQNSAFKTVEEYDNLIKSQYINQSDITDELEFNLLKRELVNNVGQFTINAFYNASDDNKAVIDWLMSNQKALRYYILGGKPEGSYYNSLTELSRLYRNYKEDFNNKEVTQYGTVLGDLYTRMAISLSLTHSKLVGLWMQSGMPENKSDSVLRYAIYRHMHKNGNLNVIAGLDITKWFENYTIEEMRFVMNNNIDDEEILWLNAYTQQFIDAQGSVGNRLTPHPYMAYVWPNYSNEIYYAEENKEYFNDLFSVPDKNNNGKKIGLWDLTYTIPGGVDYPEYSIKITRGTSERKLYKVWMNIRNKFGTGAVCGGISKTGSNIRGVHGIPSAVIGQPGHAAIIYYTQDDKGNGYWNLDNDVSGWAYSEKGERMLLGWGNANYSRGYSVVYMALAQEVINNNDIFEQSEKFVYLADSYKDDLVKQEQLYRKALEIQPLNIDAWYNLITVYNNSSNKSEDDYYKLANELAEKLKYFPLPMYHLTNLIKPKLTSIENSYKFTLLQTRILKEASIVPNNTDDNYYVYQPGLTRLEANHLLGSIDSTIATFSFDGENNNKIVLSNRFNGNGVRWDYSLDGKKTWKEVSFTAEEEHKLKLSKKEIESITADNDIYIHIIGVNYEEENLYKIDINESIGLPETLFASDLENKLLGAVDTIEWKYNEKDSWTRYGDKQPELTGDKNIILRMGATGTYLASNTSSTFTFTKDIIDNKRKYIPVSHLSLKEVSSEATGEKGSAIFALDGNYNTRWHSAWNGSDTERFISVKLDQPYNISAIEFVPAGGGNGKIYDGTILGSMDGESWFVLSEKKGLTYTNQANTVEQAIDNTKSFDIDTPQKVQYVKIVADRTNGNWFTARAFNFYEDTTIKNVASFSFDGANAGIISLYDEFKNINWKYSIDNGKTWQNVKENSYKLSTSEIEKIDNINMIKIKLGNDNTEYTINIKKWNSPEYGYLNDFENKIISQPNKENLEWKISGELEWTSYKDKEPIVLGNKTLLVRKKASGISAASDPIEYKFTDDNETDKEKYISIEHLSIHGFSSQSKDAKRPNYAPNAIDGNINTEWHTDYAVSIANTEAYISIKLDEPRYISAIDYFHMESTKEPYGFMKNGIVYVSEDGENWLEAESIQNIPQEDLSTHISFKDSVYGQYVKVVIESHDNVFATAAMINIYEDLTKIEVPVPEVKITYSTDKLTNKDVIATLSTKDNITIINNNGSKNYTFTKNGEFTFKYKDKANKEYSLKAKVDWIDKETPKGKVTYDINKLTNKNVIATISFDEKDVIIKEKTYTFTKNGEYTFEFSDKAGNKGTVKASVNWIDKEAPIGTITYSQTTPTRDSVIATLNTNEEVAINNNDGENTYTFTKNGEFTFEFTDKAGNKGTAIAKVTWINKNAPIGTITYSINSATNKDVVATLHVKDGIKITNNKGSKTYTFTKNGNFKFEFEDKFGNKGATIATVNWIDKDAPIGTITYNNTTPTKDNVIATLNTNEEVTINNNGGKNTYTFTKNGEFTFEFTDKVGNKGTAIAKVDWINKNIPVGTITYSINSATNKDVVATLHVKDGIKITNNKGSKTYTFTKNGNFKFEFEDKFGNKGATIATVNWIDKDAPIGTITYSQTTPTKDNVIATLNTNEEVFINNNGGKNTYTFTKNGEFTFEFTDKAGNKGSIIAKVDWIKNNDNNEDKPSNSNKPSNNNSSSSNNSNKDNINSGTLNTDKNKQDKIYKNYSLDNIKISILSNNIKGEVVLKKNNLPIAKLKEKFNSNSEYFELYLENNDKEKLNLSSDINITINLDKTKDFLGIYEIDKDGNIKSLNYKKVNKNVIELNTNNLGKYIISYDMTVNNNNNNSTFNTSIILIIIGVLGLILGGLIYYKKSLIKRFSK